MRQCEKNSHEKETEIRNIKTHIENKKSVVMGTLRKKNMREREKERGTGETACAPVALSWI